MLSASQVEGLAVTHRQGANRVQGLAAVGPQQEVAPERAPPVQAARTLSAQAREIRQEMVPSGGRAARSQATEANRCRQYRMWVDLGCHPLNAEGPQLHV
eukprot:5049059-Pyramimonas_sp.AAC.1